MSTPDSSPRDVRSRMICFDAGQRRLPKANVGTIVQIEDPWTPTAAPFEALFARHYRAFRELGRGMARPGLAVVAVHVPSGRLAGRVWLRAPSRGVRTAVIGRHSRADLILEDPGMSLRHLLVVVPPPSSPDPHAVGFEVRDLRTSRAFFDEEGRHLEGLVADGPAFVSCGVHALFFLQTGAPADWPEDPSEAWAGLPERVHLRDRAAEPEWWRRRARGASPEPARDREIRSQVTVIPGPVDPGAGLLEEGETPRGELEVSSMRGRMRAPVGPLALARGILLGRYRRCDASDLLDDVRISRAHLLVVEIGGRILALDTASTSGTYVRGSDEPTPCVTLDGGEEAILGDHQAVVRWA